MFIFEGDGDAPQESVVMMSSVACHRLMWQEAERKHKTRIPVYSSREPERELENSLGSHHRGLAGQVRQRWIRQWGCSLKY